MEMINCDLDAIRTEENFVADIQILLHEIMLEKGVTRAMLAERLGVSRARISQIFSSDCKNFTVRLLARAMHALGETPEISCRWEQVRQRRCQQSMMEAAALDPCNNLSLIWAEDGIVVPPDDRRGDIRSDARIRSLLKMRAPAPANDLLMQVA